MNLNDLPELREKLEAFEAAARVLLDGIDKYAEHGITPINELNQGYIRAATDIAAELLDETG